MFWVWNGGLWVVWLRVLVWDMFYEDRVLQFVFGGECSKKVNKDEGVGNFADSVWKDNVLKWLFWKDNVLKWVNVCECFEMS